MAVSAFRIAGFRTVKLNHLLTWMSVGSVVLTAVLLLVSLYFYQKANIEHTILDDNNAYAKKLAETTDRVIDISQQELAYSASTLHSLSDYQQLIAEANRLRLQSGFFNSIVVVNNQGIVQATSPESLDLQGIGLKSTANSVALKTHRPYISQPFMSTTGRYVIFISTPIFSGNGVYLGYIGGTIYLKEKSILNQIISTHFYNYTSSVSIVSNDGYIIFNKNPDRVGKKINIDNDLRSMLEQNLDGHYIVKTSNGSKLLGVANLKATNWNVFVYADSALINDIMLSTIRQSIWFIISILAFTSFLAYVFSTLIARPLRRLATLSASKPAPHIVDELNQIDTWYDEATRLKVSIISSMLSTIKQVNLLDREASTDPLTGLFNRRGFMALAPVITQFTENAVMSLDLDHFKKINDVWGHDVGDKVLEMVSRVLKSICRDSDIIGRFGGEEFIILLPGTRVENARHIAERIRATIEAVREEGLPSVTISIGIVALSEAANQIPDAIKMTDLALYEAKDAGRNCVVTWQQAVNTPQRHTEPVRIS